LSSRKVPSFDPSRGKWKRSTAGSQSTGGLPGTTDRHVSARLAIVVGSLTALNAPPRRSTVTRSRNAARSRASRYWIGWSGLAAHSSGLPVASASPQLPKSGLYGPTTKPDRTAVVRSPNVSANSASARAFDGP
jgi:hypothetical protein